MKKLVYICVLISSVAWSSDKSINYDTVVTHIHFLYKKTKMKGDVVQVKGPKLSKKVTANEESSENFAWTNRKFEISAKELAFEKGLADSAFTAISNDSYGRGTAVFIGGDFVLTNHHVYSNKYETPACKYFSITTNPDLGSKKFQCEKLIKCNKELDYCLVKMKETKGQRLSDIMKAPAIKLEIEPTGIVRLIGNIRGHGFQASAGDGIFLKGKRYLHQAPLFKGASGGPLFNNAGELIGINFAETTIIKGSKAFNFATPLKFIKESLEVDVSKEILNELLL